MRRRERSRSRYRDRPRDDRYRDRPQREHESLRPRETRGEDLPALRRDPRLSHVDRPRGGAPARDDHRHELRTNSRYGQSAYPDNRQMERDDRHAYPDEHYRDDRYDRERNSRGYHHSEMSERYQDHKDIRQEQRKDPRDQRDRDQRGQSDRNSKSNRNSDRNDPRQNDRGRNEWDRNNDRREDRHWEHRDERRDFEYSEHRSMSSRPRGRHEAREIFMTERRAPDVRELRDYEGRNDARRPEIRRKGDLRAGDRPRLSGPNDIALGPQRRSHGTRHDRRENRLRSRGRKAPRAERRPLHRNDKVVKERLRRRTADERDRQPVQPAQPEPQVQVAQVEETPPPSTPMEVVEGGQAPDPKVQKDPSDPKENDKTEQTEPAGDGLEDGEIGSESSESEECNSEADFDPSPEETITIAVAEKAEESGATVETIEAEETKESQLGSEQQETPPDEQNQKSPRRDATRTIPVPRSLSKDIAGACSSGAEIHIQEQGQAEPCLVTVSGTTEEVDVAVAQIRALREKQRANDPVELLIPRTVKGQRILHALDKEQIRRVANVTLNVEDDTEEYCKVTLCGQPPDTERAWLAVVKAALGKAEEKDVAEQLSRSSGHLGSGRH